MLQEAPRARQWEFFGKFFLFGRGSKAPLPTLMIFLDTVIFRTSKRSSAATAISGSGLVVIATFRTSASLASFPLGATKRRRRTDTHSIASDLVSWCLAYETFCCRLTACVLHALQRYFEVESAYRSAQLKAVQDA